MLELDGPIFFRWAYRLGAYTGVMQARIIELRQRDEPEPTPSGRPAERAVKVDDKTMLDKLANEGWLSRKTKPKED